MRSLVGFLVCFLFASAVPCSAASIILAKSETGCDAWLKGDIAPGDVDQLAKLVDSVGSICLDSNGGSFSEGVKLAEAFFEYSIHTAVPDGASCVSACAIAFLAGTGSTDAGAFISRSMHVNGRLAFHAPFPAADGKVSPETARKAYNSAVEAIRKLVVLADSARLSKRERDVVIPSTLLIEMLGKGPDEAFEVDTVGKASEFYISVYGFVESTDLTPMVVCNICRNAIRERYPFVCKDDLSDVKLDGKDAAATTVLSGPEGTGETCSVRVQHNHMQALWVRRGYAGETVIDVEPSYFFRPDLKLRQLPRATSPPSATAQYRFVEIARDPDQSNRWNHNGSTMELLANGSIRTFIYSEPREGMKEQGVDAGTLLFTGEKSGNSYKGTAYIFRKACEPAGYAVSGQISSDERVIVLTGKAPRLGADCKRAGVVNDTLKFELISSE